MSKTINLLKTNKMTYCFDLFGFFAIRQIRFVFFHVGLLVELYEQAGNSQCVHRVSETEKFRIRTTSVEYAYYRMCHDGEKLNLFCFKLS